MSDHKQEHSASAPVRTQTGNEESRRAACARKPSSEDAVASGRITFAGFLMGLANLVPGVSGGTMILALGLYDRFIEAVANVTRLRFSRPTLRFCLLLAVGLVAAILAFSSPFVWLVREHRWMAYSLFVGMTMGGVPMLIQCAKPLRTTEVVCFFCGLAIMLAVAFGLHDTVLAPTPATLVSVGALASASMILPGISGSYILLVLGLYDVIWSAVRPAALRSDLRGSLSLLLPVGIGVALGIGLFSNALRLLLARFQRPTHAALLGLLIGSVAGLWPFQDAKHPLLATKPAIEAVQHALSGESADEIQRASGVKLSREELEHIRNDFAGATRGDLKKMGLELERFGPSPIQISVSVVLLVGGFLLTRRLGSKKP